RRGVGRTRRARPARPQPRCAHRARPAAHRPRGLTPPDTLPRRGPDADALPRRGMLLWMSRGVLGAEVDLDGGVDLACDVALEAADDVLLGLAGLGASFDVGAGRWVVTQAAHDDAVEGGVGSSVPAAVQAVLAGRLA